MALDFNPGNTAELLDRYASNFGREKDHEQWAGLATGLARRIGAANERDPGRALGELVDALARATGAPMVPDDRTGQPFPLVPVVHVLRRLGVDKPEKVAADLTNAEGLNPATMAGIIHRKLDQMRRDDYQAAATAEAAERIRKYLNALPWGTLRPGVSAYSLAEEFAADGYLGSPTVMTQVADRVSGRLKAHPGKWLADARDLAGTNWEAIGWNAMLKLDEASPAMKAAREAISANMRYSL